jgi:hypothetical protein
MKRYQVLAINDEKDSCQCCGKSGLKKVVWIENSESGEIKHFGVVCATNPAKGFDVVKEIKVAMGRYAARVKMVNYLAHVEYKKAGGKHGPMIVETGVFPRLDPELYASIRAKIEAEGKFNY